VPYDRRGDRTDEYIQAMKAIWTQQLASYKGEFIQFKDAEVYPKPVQKPHPPVWVGGWMKLAAKRAGRYGEGWIPGWLSPKEMKVGCDILAQSAREKGRDPSKITIAVEKLATIAKTREEGLNLATPTLKTSSESYERDIDSMQFALDRHIFGSVDDVRRRVDEFIESGVQHFELKIIYPTMDSLNRQMELWAENIVPKYH
jgi:alkanesulfonate monooxygenase SsuD/methylene tetrahydromethanopterin reductase-like flavin-dependent oxidoreductase (luciferase family)